MRLHPLSFGIASAILFGLSTPLSKLLVEEMSPLQLSGILYLGGGGSLLIYRMIAGSRGERSPPVHLGKKGTLLLAGSILFGGILAPLAVLIGLKTTSAASSSLLLNFEAAATVMLAGIVFREYVGRRVVLITVLITIGAIVLSFDPSERLLFSVGAIAIILSCIFWAMDNNLSRGLSGGDITYYVMVKGLIAGSFSFILSLILGYGLPSIGIAVLSLLLGALSFGLSMALYMMSLRNVGAARTGALFAVAPFAGVFFSLIIFRGVPGWQFLIALPLMIAGLVLLFRESHEHTHEHERIAHSHHHEHDDHHRHGHERGIHHTHPHEHEREVHSHPHTPDIHHRHVHRK
jgi:drug/metabolite transporter (DMT)-like permease